MNLVMLKHLKTYIVQKGQKITGLKYGWDYIELYPVKPDEAIKKAISILLQYWKKIQEVKAQEERNAAWFVVGLIGLALFTNSE